MSLYRLARPLLFSLDPERAHRLTLNLADLAGGFLKTQIPPNPVRAMGLEFPNPVGLAAGLDKDAAHVDALAALGFGFIEVGTVTPRPQRGNPPPRLFRIVERQALVNRMGFNNAGLERFLDNLARARWRGILGINIGKNADTPPERAAEDYELCLERVYSRASYITINISSPNTQGLRALQGKEQLENLLSRLLGLREKLAQRHGKRVPVALKISPDLQDGEIQDVADAVRRHRVDALIATNTTLSRAGVENLRFGGEPGGLSGAPVKSLSSAVLRKFADRLRGETLLIGAGGILSGEDAAEKIHAGASLVQLYTGLIYRGPGLVSECASAFRVK